MITTQRRYDLLKAIIEAYIERAEPIGSKALVIEYHFPMSSATVRNDMKELEREGMLGQPHTSSGRVPTAMAYQWYVHHALEIHLRQTERRMIERIFVLLEEQSREQRYKALVQQLAEASEEAVILHTPEHDLYINGLGYLFAQPEFAARESVVGLSRELDRLDEVMDALPIGEDDSVSVVIGGDNPFGDGLSLVLGRLRGDASSVGLLGPMRMPYSRNMGLLQMVCDQYTI